jgi:hypothetical protein
VPGVGVSHSIATNSRRRGRSVMREEDAMAVNSSGGGGADGERIVAGVCRSEEGGVKVLVKVARREEEE